MKKDLKKIYRISIYNIFCIVLICISFIVIINLLRAINRELLNYTIGLNIKQESFLNIYSGFLTLILPVAILIIERIESKDNAIISETYLRYTRIFPVIVYFVFNLLLFAFIDDSYYFVITCFISTFMIIYMYYKAFKIISNLIYEQNQINIVKEEIISNDLTEQINHFSDYNLISNYRKYGVIVNNLDFIITKNYTKYPIYPERESLIVEQYNYKVLKKIVKILKEINKEYISYIESTDIKNQKYDIKNEENLNIIVSLLAIGTSTDRNRSWVTIYYNEPYEKEVKNVIKLLNEKIYKTSESNNHLYIEMAYKEIQEKCVLAINSKSSTLLKQSLNGYLDIYKNYINEISTKIGKYSYEASYDQVNSLYRPHAYDFLGNIQKNIFDYCEMIIEYKNSKLMNTLIGFLYEMILYSYDKKELLSIQFLYNTYDYLNSESLELENDDASYKKIKLEIFEFIRILKYDYNNVDKDFVHDALLVCNKTLGDIIFKLSLTNKEKCYSYYNKALDFINGIKEDVDQVNPNYSEKNKEYYNKLNDIYMNYICNLFAITSYIVNNYESKNEDISNLLLFFKHFDSNELTDILTKAIYMNYNCKYYSWDLMEMRRMDNEDGAFSINTNHYLIHLYCLLLSGINIKRINIKSNYELSVYCNNIITELMSLNKSEYADKFKDVIKDVENEEKEYIRKTSITDSKVEQFKTNFINSYEKYNKIQLLFKETNNFKIVKRKERGVHYLGIHNIVDKTYFLEKTPNNRCIIWTDFEDGYAYSFISAEEKKIAASINNKAGYVNDKILDFLNKLTGSQLKKSILFSNYDAIYDIFDYTSINHKSEKDNDYAIMFISIKGKNIPVVVIDGLDDNCIFHAFRNQLGIMKKSSDDFKIVITDFYNNDKMLNKTMKDKIKGLDLTGNDKKDHLLESVDLLIEEYIVYDDEKLNVRKFDH